MTPTAVTHCTDTALILYVHSAKKVPGHYKSSIFTKMIHINQIKSILCEAGECPFHFDTKVEGSG